MNHIFYLHLEHLAPGCTFKKASWWRQCDALNNVLLGNLGPCLPCECYFGTYQLPAGTCCWRSHTPFTYTYTLLPPQSKEGALTRNPNSSDLSPINHLRGVLDKQVSSMESASHSLQDLNDLLLKSWCQIPQHTLRGLEESMPRQVRVGLAGAGGATQYQAGGHNVMCYWYRLIIQSSKVLAATIYMESVTVTLQFAPQKCLREFIFHVVFQFHFHLLRGCCCSSC